MTLSVDKRSLEETWKLISVQIKRMLKACCFTQLSPAIAKTVVLSTDLHELANSKWTFHVYLDIFNQKRVTVNIY